MSMPSMDKFGTRRKKQAWIDAEQNYVVIPNQHWIDGTSKDHTIRQFVPLGYGKTGIQLLLHEPKEENYQAFMELKYPKRPILSTNAGIYLKTLTGKTVELRVDLNETVHDLKIVELGQPPVSRQFLSFKDRTLKEDDILGHVGIQEEDTIHMFMRLRGDQQEDLAEYAEMGLGCGGSIRQQIHLDPYGGVDMWESKPSAMCMVRIVNSAWWREITGEACPSTPICVETYNQWQLPWVEEVYDEKVPSIESNGKLECTKSMDEVQNCLDL